MHLLSFLIGVGVGQIPAVALYIKRKVTPVVSVKVAAVEAKAKAIVAEAEKKI